MVLVHQVPPLFLRQLQVCKGVGVGDVGMREYRGALVVRRQKKVHLEFQRGLLHFFTHARLDPAAASAELVDGADATVKE